MLLSRSFPENRLQTDRFAMAESFQCCCQVAQVSWFAADSQAALQKPFFPYRRFAIDDYRNGQGLQDDLLLVWFQAADQIQQIRRVIDLSIFRHAAVSYTHLTLPTIYSV